MSFQTRLKERREFIGMTRGELAKKLGITVSAVSNYENGVSTPKADILFNVFDVLHCDANYLFQDEMSNVDEFTVTLDEQELIKKYRKLDSTGKDIIDFVLEKECERTRN